MKRSHRVFVAGAAACVLVACNLIAGFESDYSVGSSGSTEGGNPDGPNAEGSTDSPINPDSSAEAGDAGTFCQRASGFVFCEDFDKAGAVSPFEFSKVETSPDASFDASVAVVPRSDGTNALRVEVANASGTSALAWLSKSVGSAPSSYSHFELELDVRVTGQTLNYAALAILTFSTGADREHGIASELAAQIGRLTPRAEFVEGIGKWYHCRLTLDRPEGGATFKRNILISEVGSDAGPIEIDGPGGTSGLSSPEGGTVELRVGAFNTAPNNGTVAVEFDNVIVRRSN